MSGSRRYALDTSIILLSFYDRERIAPEILQQGYVNAVTVSEALYVLCRKENWEQAKSFIGEQTRELTVIPSSQVTALAAAFKCKFSIALADCWTLATAKHKKVPALFAFKEAELIDHLDALKAEVEIVFLEDF